MATSETPVSAPETQDTASSETAQVKEAFLKKYMTLHALRLLSVNSAPASGELRIESVDPVLMDFLRTESGQKELARWVQTFDPAFRELDYSYSEFNSDAERGRTINDWWAGVRAEDLAINALLTRCAELIPRSTRSQLGRIHSPGSRSKKTKSSRGRH